MRASETIPMVCRGCGAPADGMEGDGFCRACEATVRVADHTGRTDGLTARQLEALR